MRTNPQFWIDPRVYNIPGGDYIQIESPEQFVPFWLAYTTPNLPRYVASIYKKANGTRVFYTYVGDKDGYNYDDVFTNPNKMRTLVNNLNSQLQHPCPTQYRLCFAHLHMVPLESSWAHGSNVETSYMLYCLNHDYISMNYHYMPGMFGLFRPVSSMVTPARGAHSQMTVKLRDPGDVFLPGYLLMVRAKHIPYLRARSHLQLPWTLEAADIKLYISADLNGVTTIDNVMVNSGIKALVKLQGIPTETIMSHEIIKLLWKPFSKKEKPTLLQDAVALALESDKEPYLEKLY